MDLRHCAFCLIELPADAVKTCGRCRRRVYCSKECQERDWNGKWPAEQTTPFGQGHRNWCGMEYGEEDLDWKVVPIQGQGLGIVALRPFPPKFRIMIDACQMIPAAHPGMKDLEPLHGTIMEKFNLNNFTYGENKPALLCMRLSRVNHACEPNASHLDVVIKDFKVKVLYSEREIEEGEEITICYSTWYNHTNPEADFRLYLQQDWNIVCPDECICRKPKVLAAVRRAREVNSEFFKFCELGKSREALKALTEILALEKTIHIPFVRRKTSLYDGFQMAIMTRATLGRAKAYINEVCEIYKCIAHPKDVKMLEYEKDKASPESNEHYLQEESDT